MKSILVALDGSPAAEAALGEAVKWAELIGAELRGIFVEDESRFTYYPSGFSAEGGVPISAPLPEDDLAREIERVRLEGEKIQALFENATAGTSLQASFSRARGNANRLLTREARAADLVVMGRRGRTTPLDSREPGPTTETLIHNAQRPVLVVPKDPSGGDGVLFAHDGSKGAQRVIMAGTFLAQKKGAAVSVLFVGDDRELREEQEYILRRYMTPYGLDPRFHFSSPRGRTSTLIVDHARREQAGLIVMGAFGHNPLHELFFGSTTLETLTQSMCPILLMA